VRCFLGGSRDEQVLQLTDENILNIVRDELRQILGVKADPLFTRLYRWKGAMAQYTLAIWNGCIESKAW
jgi:oxygen-dependent protoporphyrinogen oxidase